MIAGQTDWEYRLSELQKFTDSDFCAAAVYDASARQIRWVAASGYTNDKFRYMVSRPGQGMTGEVIRVGRMVQRACIMDGQPNTRDSIMLAEHLLIAAAAPVRNEANDIAGILLMGRRTNAIYGAPELSMLKTAAEQIWEKPVTSEL